MSGDAGEPAAGTAGGPGQTPGGPPPLPPGSAIAVWLPTEPPPKSEPLVKAPPLAPAGVQNVARQAQAQECALALPDIFREQINLSHGGAKWFDAGIRFDPASLTVD